MALTVYLHWKFLDGKICPGQFGFCWEHEDLLREERACPKLLLFVIVKSFGLWAKYGQSFSLQSPAFPGRHKGSEADEFQVLGWCQRLEGLLIPNIQAHVWGNEQAGSCPGEAMLCSAHLTPGAPNPVPEWPPDQIAHLREGPRKAKRYLSQSSRRAPGLDPTSFGFFISWYAAGTRNGSCIPPPLPSCFYLFPLSLFFFLLLEVSVT